MYKVKTLKLKDITWLYLSMEFALIFNFLVPTS